MKDCYFTKIKKEHQKNHVFVLSAPRTIALLLHYFICYMWVYRIAASYITLSFDPQAVLILPWIQWIIYAITFGVSAALAWPAIVHAKKTFCKHLRRNIRYILLLAIALLVINMALSILVSLVTKTNGSYNQQIIRQASTSIPFVTAIATTLIAPFIEECVFRCGAFAIIRKKGGFFLAAIISSLLFASIHFLDSIITGDFSDLSYLVVYMALGMVLAYSYEKSDNAAVPFAIHCINNVISMSMMLL